MNRPAQHAPASAWLTDEEIFPGADYQHRLRLGRCEPEAYFSPWDPSSCLLAERRRWIHEHPERHVLAEDSAIPALLELAELATLWTGSPAPIAIPSNSSALTASLGTLLEPDFVLLSRDSQPPRLIAGCICFPSSWAPEHKLGSTLDQIHEVVPDLNPTLGGAINAFLGRLKPGTAWTRANWGLCASPERNQHPARQLPRLRMPYDPNRTWVRIEHQALMVLPQSDAILFGIRIDQRPLTTLIGCPSTAHALGRALRSMPGPMATYKGIAEVREAIADDLLGTAHRPMM